MFPHSNSQSIPNKHSLTRVNIQNDVPIFFQSHLHLINTKKLRKDRNRDKQKNKSEITEIPKINKTQHVILHHQSHAKTVQKKGMFNNTLRPIHLIKPQTYYIITLISKVLLLEFHSTYNIFPLLKFVQVKLIINSNIVLKY